MRVDVSDLVELDKRLERAALRILHMPLVIILSLILIGGFHVFGAFMVALLLLLLSVSMAALPGVDPTVVFFRPLRYARRWAAWILDAREILICLAEMLAVVFPFALTGGGPITNPGHRGAIAANTAADTEAVLWFLVLLPLSLLVLAALRRPLRYARRWAAWILIAPGILIGLVWIVGIALLGFFAIFVFLPPGPDAPPAPPEPGWLRPLVFLGNVMLPAFPLAGGAGLAWPVAVGIAAVHQVHRLRFEGMAIDPLRCIRFRTQGPPGTWSLRKLLKVGLLLGSPVLLFLLIISALIQFQPGAWSILLLILPAALAYWSWPMARRLRRASAAEARRRDPRPPVLLLRSFRDDVLPLESRAPRRGRDRPTTFEEVLTGQLWCRGPVIAIGRPGEHIPPVGAARDYYSDAVWQTEAERMVRESQAIVMIVGITPGLGWEMRRVHDLEMLKKLALAFPPVSTDKSPQRWTGFLAQITGLSVATSLQDVPAEHVLFILFPPAEEPVSFITRGQRDPRAYLLALAAASQLIPERFIARKDMWLTNHQVPSAIESI